jgi:hypothetical protein
MVDNALQFVASELLQQATQKSKARHNLIMAAREHEQIIQRRNSKASIRRGVSRAAKWAD